MMIKISLILYTSFVSSWLLY